MYSYRSLENELKQIFIFSFPIFFNKFVLSFLSCLQQPDLLKLKEEMARINSKIKKGKKELDRKREERRKHATVIKDLQRDIRDLTAKLEDLQEESRNVGDELKLDGNDLEEYFRM